MTGEQLTALRWSTGATQTKFWGKVGVSQTCGSRYEGGRPMSNQVKLLLDLTYTLSTDEAIEKLKELRHG